ncbi:hypothetical protein D3C85_1872040 [compost metagenome]
MLALHFQAQLVDQAAAGGAGGRQDAGLEEIDILAGQLNHVVFFLVVGDQGNAGFHKASIG